MDALTYKMIAAKCETSTWEYKRMMRSLSLQDQIKVYSLSVVKQTGDFEILNMAYRIQKILGFAPHSIKYKIGRSRRGGACAYPTLTPQEIHFCQICNVECMVHEMTHLISDKDTTTKRSYTFDHEEMRYRRQNRSVHNAGFLEYLMMGIDNVLEHREELGIHLWTAEEVLYGRP